MRTDAGVGEDLELNLQFELKNLDAEENLMNLLYLLVEYVAELEVFHTFVFQLRCPRNTGK